MYCTACTRNEKKGAIFLSPRSRHCKECLEAALRRKNASHRKKKSYITTNRTSQALTMHCWICGNGLHVHKKDCPWSPRNFKYLDFPHTDKPRVERPPNFKPSFSTPQPTPPKPRHWYICTEKGHKFLSNLAPDKALCPWDRGPVALYIHPQE